MDKATGKTPTERSHKRKRDEEHPPDQAPVGDDVTIRPPTSQNHTTLGVAAIIGHTRREASTPAQSVVSRTTTTASQLHLVEGIHHPANKGRRQGGTHAPTRATNNIQYQGKVHAFPFKLHTMLEDATKQGFDSDVSWVHNGMAFKIHNRENFSKQVLPRYFSQTQYKSFQRQLNLYNFQRTESGPNAGAYSHLYFIRGNPRLCHLIVRSRRSIPGDEAPDKDRDAMGNSTTLPSKTTVTGNPSQNQTPLPLNSALSSADQGQTDRHPSRRLPQQRRAQAGDGTSGEKSPPSSRFLQESKLSDPQTVTLFSHNNSTTAVISEIALLGQPHVECHEDESGQRVSLLSSPGWPAFSMLPQRRGEGAIASVSFDPLQVRSTRFIGRDSGQGQHSNFDHSMPLNRTGEVHHDVGQETMVSRSETNTPNEFHRHITQSSTRSNEDSTTMNSNDIIDEIILTFGASQTSQQNPR